MDSNVTIQQLKREGGWRAQQICESDEGWLSNNIQCLQIIIMIANDIIIRIIIIIDGLYSITMVMIHVNVTDSRVPPQR